MNTSSTLTFSTNPTTVVTTFKTNTKKKFSVATKTKEKITDKKKSKKKLKVKTSTTKKVVLQTNSKKRKRKLTTTKTSTSEHRLVKKNNIIEKPINKTIEDDEDLALKNEIKTNAINKALDLFSNSLVKSLSDQLWDQFLIKSKKGQNSMPKRNKEERDPLPEKPDSKILRNKEKTKAPRKTDLEAVQQLDESVERFEIIL